MIHIDRNRVCIPSILRLDIDSPAKREFTQAEKFYAVPVSKRKQRHFQFKIYRHKTVRKALKELFYSKCAFCESYIPSEGIMVQDAVHFRPKSGVIGDKGEFLPDHYWWLAVEWTNLFPLCPQCHWNWFSNKTGNFPIEGKRAGIFAGPEEIAAEKPLLLNPCVDYPEEHLIYDIGYYDSDELGIVSSDTIQGQTTISILKLNSNYLVTKRHESFMDEVLPMYRKFLKDYNEFRKNKSDILLNKILQYLKEKTDVTNEYAGMKRQFIQQKLKKIPEFKTVFSDWKTSVITITTSRQQRAKESFKKYKQSQEDYSLEKKRNEEKYFRNRDSQQIKRIEIHNLKVIQNMVIDFKTSQDFLVPWKMLLGENATGKSTILHAIAMVLIGQEYFNKIVTSLGIMPIEYIRKGCKSGYIKIYLKTFSRPLTLTFFKSSVRFENSLGKISEVAFTGEKIVSSNGEGWENQVLLLGYGATRLLPRGQKLKKYGKSYARVDNLFNPFMPLVKVEQWLLNLDEDKFNYIAISLKELLGLKDEDVLLREDDHLWIKVHKTKVLLENLSDGYQSVLALAADILEILLWKWPSPEFATGIVLVDELGVHLHPTWKMRIVTDLRKLFPRIQFITTTHEPLCLRGLATGEIVVLRRDTKEKVIAVKDLPPVEGLRVDQLLTSEHFGMQCTRSLEIERKFITYYALLAKRKLNIQEKAQLEELKKELEKIHLLGTTRRERIMLEAIDKYLATEPEFLEENEKSDRKSKLDKQLNDTLTDRSGVE